MTSEIIIALIAAIAPTILATGTLIAVLRGNKDATKRDETADAKIDHVTVLTNSTLSTAMKRVEQLEDTINVIKKEKGKSDGTNKNPQISTKNHPITS
jgi:hypothetical protein